MWLIETCAYSFFFFMDKVFHSRFRSRDRFSEQNDGYVLWEQRNAACCLWLVEFVAFMNLLHPHPHRDTNSGQNCSPRHYCSPQSHLQTASIVFHNMKQIPLFAWWWKAYVNTKTSAIPLSFLLARLQSWVCLRIHMHFLFTSFRPLGWVWWGWIQTNRYHILFMKA